MNQCFFEQKTSASLLGALKGLDDQSSWRRFVGIYEPMLRLWLRFRGVSEHLIPDVIGDVYVKLVREMPTFAYDKRKSFRNWLRTVVENSASDFLSRAHRRYELVADFQDSTVEAKYGVDSRSNSDDSLSEFVEELDDKMRVAKAIVRRVRARINAKTWSAFYLTEVEGKSCEEVGSKLRMQPSNVYIARFRVRKYLKTETEKTLGQSQSS